MSVIVLLIAAGGIVATGFLFAFVWAVRSGQFDDTSSPPVRLLRDTAALEIQSPAHKEARSPTPGRNR